jgi:hypothetical protein
MYPSINAGIFRRSSSLFMAYRVENNPEKEKSRMSNLMPSDIREEVDAVLRGVQINAGDRGRSYLTAYQILERLPDTTKGRLIDERGRPGSGSGHHYAAASVVSDAAEMISDIEIAFLEASLLNISVNGTSITPSPAKIGLYRVVNK